MSEENAPVTAVVKLRLSSEGAAALDICVEKENFYVDPCFHHIQKFANLDKKWTKVGGQTLAAITNNYKQIGNGPFCQGGKYTEYCL